MNEDLQHDLDRNEIYALVSFGRKQTQEGKYSNLFFPVYVGMVDAAMAIDPGISIEWHGPYTWDPVSEITAIRTLTGRQVDGIIVTATGSEGLTPVINAAIQPVVSSYLQHVRQGLEKSGYGCELLVMQSSGGVTPFSAAEERPVTIVESGPAAGVMAAAHLGRALSTPNLVSLDMGGTTAKVGPWHRGSGSSAALGSDRRRSRCRRGPPPCPNR